MVLDSPKYVTIHKNTLKSHNIVPVEDSFVFLFDIDDTLYKMSKEMQDEEMAAWREAYTKLNKGKSSEKDFYKILLKEKMFGAGIYAEFGVSARHVEDLRNFNSYEKFIQKNERLIQALKIKKESGMHCRMWCFTNGLKTRAERILQCLDLINHFEGVICIDDSEIGLTGKPAVFSYKFVESVLGITNKERVYFFDDNLHNIEMGLKFGWKCVMVEKNKDIVELIENVRMEIKPTPER